MSTADDSTEEVASAKVPLEHLLSQLLRSDWQVTFEPTRNEWGGLTTALVVFTKADIDPRTVSEDMAALKSGEPPSTPIETRIDLFDSQSLYKAIKRIHSIFVRRKDSDGEITEGGE